MKRIFLLFVCVISVISVFAQDLKPCGTSVLAHRHVREGSASSRARFRETPQQSA